MPADPTSSLRAPRRHGRQLARGVVDRLREDVDAPTRWPALDGIRGAAMLAVIAYHVYRVVLAGPDGRDVDVPVWLWPAGLGKFSIDVFFVLSGFLVVGSWHSLRRRLPSGQAMGRFLSRRLRRVLPVWWLSLVVLVPLLAPQLLALHRLGDLAALATVQQYVVGGLTSEVNVPAWSLTVEVQFYLLVPLVAWLMTRLGRWTVLVASLALSVWWASALGVAVGLPASSLPGRLDQFVVGAVVASLVAEHARRRDEGRGSHPVVRLVHRPPVPWASAALLVGLAAHHGSSLGISSGHPVDRVLHPVAGVLLGLLFLRLLTPTGGTAAARGSVVRAFSHRGLRLVGLLSYSAYLWHYPLVLAVLGATGLSASGELSARTVVATAGYLAVLAVASVASYLAVERRLLVARRREERPATGEGDDPALVGAVATGAPASVVPRG